jgi:hypothetical protein
MEWSFQVKLRLKQFNCENFITTIGPKKPEPIRELPSIRKTEKEETNTDGVEAKRAEAKPDPELLARIDEYDEWETVDTYIRYEIILSLPMPLARIMESTSGTTSKSLWVKLLERFKVVEINSIITIFRDLTETRPERFSSMQEYIDVRLAKSLELHQAWVDNPELTITAIFLSDIPEDIRDYNIRVAP